MLNVLDILIGTYLSYCLTGYSMVNFHSQQPLIHQPFYVEKSFYKRFLAGLLWPITAKANKELSWFIITFLGGCIVFSIFHAVAYSYVGSSALVSILLFILAIAPITSVVIGGLLSIVSLFLWFVLAKPFGLKFPKSVERTYNL